MTTAFAEPILVGRESELRQLHSFFESADLGHGATIFVAGVAGSGKTRIVAEFANNLKSKQATVLFGWCLSNCPIPYFPFIEALNSRVGGKFSSSSQSGANWLMQSSSDNITTDKLANPEVWRDRAFAAVTKELLFLTSGKALILVLEDIHWADSASLALLNYLSRIVPNERLLIIATFRTEELLQTTKGYNILAQTLHAMGRDGLFTQIDLLSLNSDNVVRIAESMLSGSVDPLFATMLTKESQGNPLFVVESIRMLAEQKLLKEDKGKWKISGNRITIPSKVKEVILSRLGLLNTDQRAVLEAAAVIGDNFNAETIGAVLGKGDLSVLQVLEELKSSSLVKIKADSYFFSHEKIRELIYGELSEPLRRKYHERTAEEMVLLGSMVPRFGEIAHHYDKAGNKKQAIMYSLVAGEDALKRYSNAEAIESFQYVLEASTSAISVKEMELALEGLGDAYYADCRFEDAISTYMKLAQSTDNNVQLRAYRKEMEAIWYKEQDSARLLSVIEKAEKSISLDRIEKARILWNKARAIMWLGQLKGALKAHQEALEVFEREYSLPDIAQLSFGLGVNRVMLGKRIEEGIGEILRAKAIFRDLEYLRGENLASYIGGVDCFLLCGLFEECYANAEKVIKIGERIGDYDNLAQAWWRLSDIPESDGEISTAISFCLKALNYSKKTDARGTECKIYAKLAKYYALKNDFENADIYYNRLIAISPGIVWHPRNLFHVAYNLAAFFAVKGDLEGANEYFKRYADFIVENYPNSMGLKFIIQKQASWFLEKKGQLDKAKKVSKEADCILAEAQDVFNCANLQAFISVKREIRKSQEFEIRVDLVNAGRRSASMVSVEGILAPELDVIEWPLSISPNSCHFLETGVSPFGVRSFKIKVKAKQTGVLSFEPVFHFIDELGNKKTAKVDPIRVDVLPSESQEAEQKLMPERLAFESVSGQKAFDFLVNAYNEDFVKRKFHKDGSGWRTLLKISKGALISHYSVYGSSCSSIHGLGPAILELRRMGLIDIRFFFAERGRGGKILKVRIADHILANDLK